MTTLSLPTPQDSAEYAGLSQSQKEQVMRWVEAVQKVIDLKPRQAAVRALAEQMHVAMKTAERKFYAWLARPDWRVFVDRRKDLKKTGLSEEDQELVKMYCERNQRKSTPAIRKLLRDFAQGTINTKTPVDPATGYPHGWTARNLLRYVPSKFELSAARKGCAGAAQFRPLVFTTRRNLRVGQFYMFDDIWHDHKVALVTESLRGSGLYRPLEFHALDLFSACKFAWGIKPRVEDDLTGRMKTLCLADFRFLLAKVLAVDGYRNDEIGTTLIVEHGTAAIPDELEKMLFDFYKIRVDRSGIQGASSFAGQFGGASKGNFRFKAALESLGNLIHNEMADLPGQVGRNRDESPEELHGRERYGAALIRAMVALPPERVAALRLPFLNFQTFLGIAGEIYARINARTDHDLEGWIEAGLVVDEFRLALDQVWMPTHKLLDYSAEQMAAMEAVITAPNMQRVRRMSPTEVYHRGRGELGHLPPHGVAMILGKDLAVTRKVQNNGLFEFEDMEVGPGEHRYLAQIADRYLERGEKYLTHVNPFAAHELIVSDAAGRFLGVCPRWEKISRDETDTLHRQCGRAAKIEGDFLAPLAKRGAALTREKTEMHRHNARVLSGAPTTPEAKGQAEDIRRRVKKVTAQDVEDFVTAGHGDDKAPESPAPDTDDFDSIL